MEDWAPKPNYRTMAKHTEEREELYRKVPPPREPIPFTVPQTAVSDKTPGDEELWERVVSLY